ncbi:MAG: ornithine carbamoyltransferase [Planctomycetes bacterium]|nr:ornithine carbamoyltransferase [Planctomycetota bacterium]
MKDFVNILDHSTAELESLLARCADLKTRLQTGVADRLLIGRRLMTIFEKPSTRTRVSLEAAAASMGATAITQEMIGGTRLGEREPIKDIARVISRYVDLIAIRTFEHSIVKTFAEWADVPVINTLSDYSHPTQAMADIMTIREHLGTEKGKTLAFIGDGNNVARSLASAAGLLGMRFVIASPKGFELDGDFTAKHAKKCPQADFQQVRDAAQAVADANIIYTDVWASMGQEEEAQARREQFAEYQVNTALLAKAPPDCIIMHDLPAHRGEEITDEAIESANSVVFDQAENRMHFYRGLFAELLAE